MPRPGVGNPGNKGGARKSAYVEHQDAQWHADVWKNQQQKEVLDQRIATGVFSGRDMALKKLLVGDRTIVAKFMDKLVPDLHQFKGEVNIALLPIEELQKRIENAKNDRSG